MSNLELSAGAALLDNHESLSQDGMKFGGRGAKVGRETTEQGVKAGDREPYADGAAFVDGKFVPVAEARVPILDWGFLRSDATYDVAHVWRGSFFRLEDHLERFERSMQHLRLSPSYGRDEIRDILVECVRLSGLRDAYAELICTRGIPRAGSRDPRECENRFYAFVVPFVWIANLDKQERGLHAIIGNKQRIAPESVDPTVKNYHWLDLEVGLFEAYDRGGETVILTDAEGNVVEGPGFNVFAVKSGAISTPDRGVLEGITRKTVIELANEHSIQLDVRPVPANELRSADEVFLSSTAGGVIPVTTVDGEAVGDGGPGPVTLLLRDAYWNLHDDPRFLLPVSYG
jgi:branched-chain amino acid aminotransferase